VDGPDVGEALSHACALTDDAYVVDLAWLRSTPWRERIAGAFDPPDARAELQAIDRVEIRHHPDSEASALLMLGWLSPPLGWTPRQLERDGAGLRGSADAGGREVALSATPDVALTVRGLATVALHVADGRELQLDRGPGGLRAHDRGPGGDEREWTIMG